MAWMRLAAGVYYGLDVTSLNVYYGLDVTSGWCVLSYYGLDVTGGVLQGGDSRFRACPSARRTSPSSSPRSTTASRRCQSNKVGVAAVGAWLLVGVAVGVPAIPAFVSCNSENCWLLFDVLG